jgi:glutaminyl-tRNA synthetase
VPAEVRLYNHLLAAPQPDAANFAVQINHDSLETLIDCVVKPTLATTPQTALCSSNDRPTSAATGTAASMLVFNRTVGLRDTLANASLERRIWSPAPAYQ